MEDTLTIIVAIFLGAILMFIFPMMAISERNDDVSELAVQTAVSEFVNTTRTKGKITVDDYDTLVSSLYATGNTYDIVIEIQVLDENVGKKETTTLTGEGSEKIVGENLHYSRYTTQIMEELEDKDVVYMKEGDVITVSASNSNNTISQSLKNFFYSLSGNNTYSIVGSQSGIVTVTGQ